MSTKVSNRILANKMCSLSRLFFFLLFVVSFRGFSQEKYEIPLVQGEEYNTFIKIDEISIPVVFNWDKEDNSILIQFRGINVSDKFLYFFPKTEILDKAKKKDKQIWFGNNIRKEGKVSKCVDNLVNVVWKNVSEDIKESTLGSPAPIKKCEFLFKVQDAEIGSCSFALRAYLAITEKEKGASKRPRKIDAMSNIVLDISLYEICKSPTLKNIIDTIAKKTANVNEDILNIAAEADSLARLVCKDVRDRKVKPFVAETNKLNIITDERYAHYNNCINLKTVIAEYNLALIACDNTIKDYNKKLQDKQRKCKLPVDGVELKKGDCELIKVANRDLMNLFYKMEQGEKNNFPALKTEFEGIKKTIIGCERCKNDKEYNDAYKAYESWCNGIEKLLKKSYTCFIIKI
jgi:hypothetical protein